MNTSFFILIGLIMIAWCVFMIIRNHFVLKVHQEWLNFVKTRYAIWAQEENFNSVYKYSPVVLINAIASYEEMLWKFWVFDLNRFVKNWNLYHIVMGTEKQNHLRVIK